MRALMFGVCPAASAPALRGDDEAWAPKSLSPWSVGLPHSVHAEAPNSAHAPPQGEYKHVTRAEAMGVLIKNSVSEE